MATILGTGTREARLQQIRWRIDELLALRLVYELSLDDTGEYRALCREEAELIGSLDSASCTGTPQTI